MSGPIYDTIGEGYTAVRRSDPRIEARLWSALGGAHRVLNVGAGAASYEPADRVVFAVEPSPRMLGQRPPSAAPAVRAVAEELPFADGAFDATLAVLTVHHWTDPAKGLSEVRRVTRGPVVVLTFDKAVHDAVWLTEYLPEMVALDHHHLDSSAIAERLGGGRVEELLVPHDCTDGFAHAYWRHPEAYLDPAVRAGISSIARLPDEVVDRAVAKLRADLESGVWAERYPDLLTLAELDAGFRIVVAGHADTAGISRGSC
jgi:SAM-dependent methyltransferase